MALYKTLVEGQIDPDEFDPSQFDSVLGALSPRAPEKAGILSRLGRGLADPRVNAILAGASRGFGELSRPSLTPMATGAGAALAAGFRGASDGAQSYEEMLAQQAAQSLKQKMEERRLAIEEAKAAREGGSAWNTDLSNQIDILSGGLLRDAASKGVEMSPDEARERALNIVMTSGAKSRKSLEEMRQDFIREMEGRKPQIAGEMETARQDAILTAKKLADFASAERSETEFEQLAADINTLLDKASGSFFGNLSSEALSRMNLAGEKEKANQSLKVLGGELLGKFAETQILGINPTAADTNIYRDMAGQIADNSLDPDVRKSALEWVVKKARDRRVSAEAAAGVAAPTAAATSPKTASPVKKRTAAEILNSYRR